MTDAVIAIGTGQYGEAKPSATGSQRVHRSSDSHKDISKLKDSVQGFRRVCANVKADW